MKFRYCDAVCKRTWFYLPFQIGSHVQFRSQQSVATEAWLACCNVYVCWKVPWFFFFPKTLSYWRFTEMLPMAELPLRWPTGGQFRETEEAALGCQRSSGIWLPQTSPPWDKRSRTTATIVPISPVQKAQVLNILIVTAYPMLSSLKYSSMCTIITLDFTKVLVADTFNVLILPMALP